MFGSFAVLNIEIEITCTYCSNITRIYSHELMMPCVRAIIVNIVFHQQSTRLNIPP